MLNEVAQRLGRSAAEEFDRVSAEEIVAAFRKTPQTNRRYGYWGVRGILGSLVQPPKQKRSAAIEIV